MWKQSAKMLGLSKDKDNQLEQLNKVIDDPYEFLESDNSDETIYISPSVSSECGSDILKIDKETIKQFESSLKYKACNTFTNSMNTLQVYAENEGQNETKICENITSGICFHGFHQNKESTDQSKNYLKVRQCYVQLNNINIQKYQINKKNVRKFENNNCSENNINIDLNSTESAQEELELFDLSGKDVSSGSIYCPSSEDSSKLSDSLKSLDSSKSSESSSRLELPLSINNQPSKVIQKNPKIVNSTYRAETSFASSLCMNTKKDLCPFCYTEVGHFSRHLERSHSDIETVKKVMQMPLKSTERRNAIILLRRKGNFVLQKEQQIIKPVKKPMKSNQQLNNVDYSVCVNCFGFIKSTYLARHRKHCKANTENFPKKYGYRSEAQNFLVGTGLLGNYINKSRLTDVFKIMRADEIGLAAKSDPIICLYGESILGKHKRKQMYTSISQKMRGMAKLLIALRKLTTGTNFFEMLKPEYYNYMIAATKEIGGYNPEKLTMASASIALHMSTDLKHLCNVAKKAVITKDCLIGQVENAEEKRKQIEQLIEMIESHWCHDIGSLANKVLNENKIENPKLLPTTEDVFKFNTYTSTMANEAYNKLINKENIETNYNILSKCTLALLLLFNRRRLGEIQFLDIKTYERPPESFNQEEMLSCLTEFEKSLCKMFKRVIVFGKGSKPVPILFSKLTQKYTDLIIQIRRTTNIVPKENKYVFALSGSTRWINGSMVIQKLSRECGATQPELLRSTRFRKQIATILQIMNFGQDELTQIAKFMGHTEKTHMEFYRLTENTYQTAKVAKVLLLLESGRGAEFKGKSLDEININEEELMEDNEQPSTSGTQENFNEEPQSSRKQTEEIEKKSKGRIKWDLHQKKKILDTFKNHIRKSIPPKKSECIQFIKDNPEFTDCDWVRIKTLVFNTYRNK